MATFPKRFVRCCLGHPQGRYRCYKKEKGMCRPMKKVMFVLVLLNWLLIGSRPSQALPGLSFIPSTRDIGLGEVRTVELQIGGVFPSLGAFDIFIDFYPAVVSFKPSASSFGGPLGGDQLACPGLPNICTDFGSIGDFILVDSDTLELFRSRWLQQPTSIANNSSLSP